MKLVPVLIAICLFGLGGPSAVVAGKTHAIDPAGMQPALNPAFDWDCWQTGAGIICEAAGSESYEGLVVDFLACEGGPVYSGGTYSVSARRVGNADGLALTTTFRDSYVEWFSADPEGSGLRLRSTGHRKNVFTYAVAGDPDTVSLSTIGVVIRVTGPGLGVLMQDVGHMTWDSDGNLVKSAGSHITEDSFAESHAMICNALNLGG
jgi:hypothetical protein